MKAQSVHDAVSGSTYKKQNRPGVTRSSTGGLRWSRHFLKEASNLTSSGNVGLAWLLKVFFTKNETAAHHYVNETWCVFMLPCTRVLGRANRDSLQENLIDLGLMSVAWVNSDLICSLTRLMEVFSWSLQKYQELLSCPCSTVLYQVYVNDDLPCATVKTDVGGDLWLAQKLWLARW